jgi:hypothetical protein
MKKIFLFLAFITLSNSQAQQRPKLVVGGRPDENGILIVFG